MKSISQTMLHSLNLKDLLRVMFIILLTITFVTSCEKNSLTASKKDMKNPCEENHTGDWCFKNEMTDEMVVDIDPGISGSGDHRQITVKPNQIKCIYHLVNGCHQWQSQSNTGGFHQDG